VADIKGAIRRLDAFQRRHRTLGFAWGVQKHFSEVRGGVLVANLAYGGLVSLFPLLLLGLSVLELFFGSDPALRRRLVASEVADFPIIGSEIRNNLHPLRASDLAGVAVGLAGLAWGSLGLAQAAFFAMAEMWELPARQRLGYWARLRRGAAFIGILALGSILTTAAAGFAPFGTHNSIAVATAGLFASWVVGFFQFLGGFRVLLPSTIPAKELLWGSVFGAVSWGLLQSLGGYLVGHELRHDTSLYGIFAVFLGLAAWIYLVARLSLYAASLSVVASRHLWPRPLLSEPGADDTGPPPPPGNQDGLADKQQDLGVRIPYESSFLGGSEARLDRGFELRRAQDS
jgi:YihY family inner membrane protein